MKRITRILSTALALVCCALLAGSAPVQASVQKPDLQSQTFAITYSADTGLYTLRVGIHNNGPGNAAPCTLRMVRYTPTTVLGRPAAMVVTSTHSVPSIVAYATYTITINLGGNDPEDDWADFTIDSNNVIDESNETNNIQRVYLW